MKQCPTCRMTVCAENECPFCHTTLTFEPGVPAEKEHIVYNKYYWIYLAKTAWFSVVCALFCLIRVLLVRPAPSFMLLYMSLMCLIALVASLTQRSLTKAIRWKWQHTAEYAAYKAALWKYLFGAIAVLFSLFV
ncbi:MAG: hypothetical protein IJY66_03830 [Clostridia bacterium]|nr:hypothetical protein [Clostridia bacterium]